MGKLNFTQKKQAHMNVGLTPQDQPAYLSP